MQAAELQRALEEAQNFGTKAYAETQRINDLWLATERARNELESKFSSAAFISPELEEEIRWLRLRVALDEMGTETSGETVAAKADAREHGQRAKQRRFAASNIELAWIPGYGPALNDHPTKQDSRVALITIPKSGTYFLGEILKGIGFLDAGIHGAIWGFNDHRSGSKSQILNEITERNVRVPIEEYIDLIRPGEFFLNHLPDELRTRVATASFKRIFLVRNLRDCFVSYMRYVAKLGLLSSRSDGWSDLSSRVTQMERFAEIDGQRFFELARPLEGWAVEPGTLQIRYEDIMGDNGKERRDAAVDAIIAHVGVPPADTMRPDLDRIREHDTLTATGARSKASEWWSPRVEAKFVELGGEALSRSLGYG